MLAFWLVGFEEESAESSGEICVAELFGHAIGARRSGVRIGVKAHGDPRLSEDMKEVALDLDATDWHTDSAEWTELQIRFFVDDQMVRTVQQRINYPLQIMIDLLSSQRTVVETPPRIRSSGRSRPSADTNVADASGPGNSSVSRTSIRTWDGSGSDRWSCSAPVIDGAILDWGTSQGGRTQVLVPGR